MKKLMKLIGFISLFAASFAASFSNPGNGTPPLALAAEVEWSGDLEITGDLKLTGAGKGLVFPDASRQTTAPPNYARTIIVSPVGTAAQNGASLLAKRAAIIDASTTKPYLIKIEPGIYDVGTTSFVMGQYIDIEGSGIESTTIAGTVENSVGVIVGASNSEIRMLNVENTGSSNWSAAIFCSGTSPQITSVRAFATGATTNSAIYNSNGASPVLTGVEATASGGTNSYGIYSDLSTPTMLRVQSMAQNATGMNCGIYNERSSSILTLSDAKGQGGTTAIGIWDNNNSSSKLVQVTAEAAGGSTSIGIRSSISSPSISHTIATGSGGSYSYGILMGNGIPILRNVIAQSSSSAHCTGIQNFDASPVMTNVTATASDGTTSNYGLHNVTGPGVITADRCSFTGNTRSVSNVVAFTFNMGATKLEGPVDSPGTWLCANCYNGSGAALNASCQ